MGEVNKFLNSADRMKNPPVDSGVPPAVTDMVLPHPQKDKDPILRHHPDNFLNEIIPSGKPQFRTTVEKQGSRLSPADISRINNKGVQYEGEGDDFYDVEEKSVSGQDSDKFSEENIKILRRRSPESVATNNEEEVRGENGDTSLGGDVESEDIQAETEPIMDDGNGPDVDENIASPRIVENITGPDKSEGDRNEMAWLEKLFDLLGEYSSGPNAKLTKEEVRRVDAYLDYGIMGESGREALIAAYGEENLPRRKPILPHYRDKMSDAAREVSANSVIAMALGKTSADLGPRRRF